MAQFFLGYQEAEGQDRVAEDILFKGKLPVTFLLIYVDLQLHLPDRPMCLSIPPPPDSMLWNFRIYSFY